jgi:hypothetical protein
MMVIFVDQNQVKVPRMRKVEGEELAQLKAGKTGFVANMRPVPKLHWVGCSAVEGMYTPKYEKIFFEELAEADEWLRTNCKSFERCDYCEWRCRIESN